jgi:hypothetical protein
MITLRPATLFDAFAFGGNRGFLRKALVFQVRRSVAYVVERDGAALALVMIMGLRKRLAEFAMVLTPLAPAMLRWMIRLAHLTLTKIAQDGTLVKAHVRPSNAKARRMAELVGFQPGGFRDPSVWLFRRASA